MGRKCAFTAKVVMLRASRQVKLGPSELVDSAIGSYFAAGFGCEVTAFTTEPEQGGGGSKLWRAHFVVPTPMLLKFKTWRERSTYCLRWSKVRYLDYFADDG